MGKDKSRWEDSSVTYDDPHSPPASDDVPRRAAVAMLDWDGPVDHGTASVSMTQTEVRWIEEKIGRRLTAKEAREVDWFIGRLNWCMRNWREGHTAALVRRRREATAALDLSRGR